MLSINQAHNDMVEQRIKTDFPALNIKYTNTLLRCDFGRIAMQHVNFHIALPRKFLQAHGTDISFDTLVGREMVVIVRANGEAFSASLTPIPGRILVDMSDVFVQTTLA